MDKKVSYKYDKHNKTFYIVFGPLAKNTLNISIDEDIVLRFCVQRKEAIGFIVTNFDKKFSKLKGLIGSANEDLLLDYFNLSLKSFNNLIMPILASKEERKTFRDLINGGEKVFA